jgi:hypothetical protein
MRQGKYTAGSSEGKEIVAVTVLEFKKEGMDCRSMPWGEGE